MFWNQARKDEAAAMVRWHRRRMLIWLTDITMNTVFSKKYDFVLEVALCFVNSVAFQQKSVSS